jgi:hypothetical protein
MSFTNLWGGIQTAGNWISDKINQNNEFLENQQNQPVNYQGPQDVDYTGSNPAWANQNQTINQNQNNAVQSNTGQSTVGQGGMTWSKDQPGVLVPIEGFEETYGQTNLTEDEVNSPDSLLEAAANESEFDNSNNEVNSDGTTSETSDLGSGEQKAIDAKQKMTDSNRPFRNLFQKMKQGMSKFDKGNIGSAKWDENEFMLDEEGNPLKDEAGNLTINENFGKMTDKGKGLFGKEGGFMSKFGTGKGAMAGLMGGLGAGLSGMGGGGGTQAPSEYMYKNPWEGVQ